MGTSIAANGVHPKDSGAFYTPEYAVGSLVSWAVRKPSDRLLDPACGDGRFVALHANSVGVEQDVSAAAAARARAQTSLIHNGDFFTWASSAGDRFDCAAGNPPFIRYQKFNGGVRQKALEFCNAHGARLSCLSSSWAPFIVATATLLRPGGRLAFVVPAEIGHATYSQTVLEYLASRFSLVHIVAVQRRIFPNLSEDCWLLYAEGYGGSTDGFGFSQLTQFGFMPDRPRVDQRVSVSDWRRWGCRLRPFLLSPAARSLYREIAENRTALHLSDIADVGIGYVTGANDFFHLRPSEASKTGISGRWLHPSVRSGKYLPRRAVTERTVQDWISNDAPVLLLKVPATSRLPATVRAYLDSPAGKEARRSYKCRARHPWYAVPDVRVPRAFLSYMSTDRPALVANEAGCVCTNAVHAVHFKRNLSVKRLQTTWNRPLTQLSCELEGHPLGGGLLKLEPREAGRVVVADRGIQSRRDERLVKQSIQTLQAWRHRG